MSLKGWRFTHYETLRYFFEQETSKDLQYHIDYHSSSAGDKDEYLQLFEDGGWETVFTYAILDGDWCYFRKEVKENENLEIYTDNKSKIDLFKKTRLKWGLFGLLLTGVILPIILMVTSSDYFFTNVFVAGVLASVVLLYIKLVLNITRKIHYLKE